MFDFSISGQGLFLAFAGLAILVLSIILIARYFLAKKSFNKSQYSPKNQLRERNKYASVDAFRWRNTFLKTGMAVALLAVIFAFSWAQFEEEIVIPEITYTDEDIFGIIPPTNHTPPPPPPPPPPPVIIEEVPEDEVKEDVDFVDTTVEVNEHIETPIIDKTPPPPPAPPAPVEEEIAPIFKVVEEMPRFKSDKCEELSKNERNDCAQAEMLKFIYKNINYPSIARENGVQGTVVVRFVVNEQGLIEAPEMLRDIGAGCGDEVLRIVKKMPAWKPGKQRGRSVSVYFNLPVKFVLD